MAIGLAFVIALAAIGPTRLQAWWRSFNPNGDAEEQRSQDVALQDYLAQMEQWVLDKGRPLASSSLEDPRRRTAQQRTLAILERLIPQRKRSVLRFLHALELIKKNEPVISLAGADLSGAHLVDMKLTDSDLAGVDLSGADLTDTWLNDFRPGPGDLTKALIDGVYEGASEKPIYTSTLVSANLSNATLKEAMLAGCNLQSVNLSGADLTGADLRGADLQLTRCLTQKQLSRAHGGTNQEEETLNTSLPEGLDAPHAWSKPISEQRNAELHQRVREHIAHSLDF